MNNHKTLGVIVWPTHIEFEGVNAVLDRLVNAGVTAVATAPKVVEPTEDPLLGRREPPDDGEKGLVRVVDRPIWGQKSLRLRTSPSYEANIELYKGLKYQPPKADDLTSRNGHFIDEFISGARSRGLKTYLHVQVCHLPGMDPENSNIPGSTEDLPRLPNGELPKNRMVHFASIASDHVRNYFRATLRDVMERYKDIDGLLLDRAEQSFYTLEDAFLDFGSSAREKAERFGFNFEALQAAAQKAYSSLKNISTEDLRGLANPTDMVYGIVRLLRDEPMIGQALRLRADIASSYIHELRAEVDSTCPGKEMIPVVFPPPLSLLTGVDFKSYADASDAVMIKFFTMHWSLIVTYWAESLKLMNPNMDEASLVKALSVSFGFEKRGHGSSIADYRYPGPNDVHRAGSDACIGKIRQAIADVSGGSPILPTVHGYGPIEDVHRRFKIGWDEGAAGMWINRYGYLSDEKLEMLKHLVKNDECL